MPSRSFVRRSRSALAALPILAFACGAAPAPAAPTRFPMPDGGELIREETDVAPYLAAWKSAALAKQFASVAPATANQLQYDARWYDLDLTFTPATSSVSGTVRMLASVVSGAIATVDLDFYSNLVVDAVTSAGAATTTRG